MSSDESGHAGRIRPRGRSEATPAPGSGADDPPPSPRPHRATRRPRTPPHTRHKSAAAHERMSAALPPPSRSASASRRAVDRRRPSPRRPGRLVGGCRVTSGLGKKRRSAMLFFQRLLSSPPIRSVGVSACFRSTASASHGASASAPPPLLILVSTAASSSHQACGWVGAQGRNALLPAPSAFFFHSQPRRVRFLLLDSVGIARSVCRPPSRPCSSS